MQQDENILQLATLAQNSFILNQQCTLYICHWSTSNVKEFHIGQRKLLNMNFVWHFHDMSLHRLFSSLNVFRVQAFWRGGGGTGGITPSPPWTEWDSSASTPDDEAPGATGLEKISYYCFTEIFYAFVWCCLLPGRPQEIQTRVKIHPERNFLIELLPVL